MSVVLAGLVSSLSTLLLGLLTWFGLKAYRRAQVRKMDAESDRTEAETRRTHAESAKTEAESWQMLNGGLSARVTALELENTELRRRLTKADARAEAAEAAARKCQLDVDDLRRRLSPESPSAPGGV